MTGLAAIQYAPEAFDTRVGKMMGRQMAGETFLKAWIAHSGADPLTAWVHSQDDGKAFVRHAREIGHGGATALAGAGHLQPLIDCGALWLADPSVGHYAWDRRWFGQAAWSIVGLTHTISTHNAQDRICAMLAAPVQPWDALICTSQAARAVVLRTLEAEKSYLAERVGATRFAVPQLPVIPLGVDCDRLEPDLEARTRWRAELGLTDEDVAILQFGRLTFHAKAHPVPLYLSLERASATVGRKLHLIFAGQFANEPTSAEYRIIAERFSNAVVTHFVDGRRADVDSIRAAADIGALLSDNVQETFGLAPVELMAAGLPVIGSDWDGLRDTIEHGVTGFRIDTVMPPAGSGDDLARSYGRETISFDIYLAATSQSIAVDVVAAAEAFAALAGDADLRRRMGDAGRRRARALFDWPVVIGQYVGLLGALAERRRSAVGEIARPGGDVPVHAARLDPFDNFAAYGSEALGPETRVMRSAGPWARVGDLGSMRPMALLVDGALPSAATLDAILAAAESEPCRIVDLLLLVPGIDSRRLYRGVGWLLKFGFLSRA